jgi:cytochrome c556
MDSRFGGAAAAALALGAAAAAGAALAHEDMGKVPNTPAGRAVAARHQSFKQLGGAFKALVDELKKPSPDKTGLAASAQKMNDLASQQISWFPAGSGPESGAKTAAKPEIWRDPAGFAAAVQRLQGATTKLQQVAVAGDDLDALKAQVRETGGACKNCHDKFRVPDRD